MENLIRVIKRSARKFADDHPSLTLASCVSLACISHNNGFKTEDTRQFNGHLVRTMRGTVSRRLCPLRFRDVCDEQISARTGERCHQSRPAHDSFARKTFNLEPGTWVMYFRRGKVTRGAVGAPSKSGLWLGPGPRPFNNGVGRCIARPGQIGVVWLSHERRLIRCHPTQLPWMQ